MTGEQPPAASFPYTLLGAIHKPEQKQKQTNKQTNKKTKDSYLVAAIWGMKLRITPRT